MNAVLRIAAVALLVVSIGGLVLAVVTVRRETKVRQRWEAARIAISVSVAVAMITVLSVGMSVGVGLAAVGAGAALGWWQGATLDVRVSGPDVFARRNMAGIAAWGVGIVVVQAASIANRTGLVRLGLAVAFLSAAMAASLVASRSRTVRRVRSAATPAAAAVVVALALAAPVVPSSPAAAMGITCPPSVGGLGLVEGNPRDVSNSGYHVFACDYRPGRGDDGPTFDTHSPMSITARWATDADIPSPVACGDEDAYSSTGDRGSGYVYSDTTQALVSYRVSDVNRAHDLAALQGLARSVLAEIEGAALRCPTLDRVPGGEGGSTEPFDIPEFDEPAPDGATEYRGAFDFAAMFGASSEELASAGFLGLAANDVVLRVPSRGGPADGLGFLVGRWDNRPFSDAVGDALLDAGTREFGGVDTEEPECFYAQGFQFSFDGRFDRSSGRIAGDATMSLEPNRVVSGCASVEWDASETSGVRGSFEATLEGGAVRGTVTTSEGAMPFTAAAEGAAPVDNGVTPGEGPFAGDPYLHGETSLASDGGDDGGSDDDIDPDEATAIGIIGALGMLGLLGSSLGEAGVSASDVFTALRRGGRQGLADLLRGGALPEPGDSKTVVLTGDAARDALAGGVGATVPLDPDDQHDWVASGGGTRITGPHGGTHGTITGISGVVTTDDGDIVVTVDIDHETPTESNPPGDGDGQGDGDRASDGDSHGDGDSQGESDSQSESDSDGDQPPAAEGDEKREPVPPPVEGEGDEPVPPPVGGEGDEPVPPPVEGEGDEPVPPPVGGEGDEPVPPPVGGEGEGDGASEPAPGDPPPGGDVVLTDQEVDDMVQWGIDHGRPVDDIQGDIDGLNRARGGTGTIDISDRVATVDTPEGPVIMTPEEADRYRDAGAEIERLRAGAEPTKSLLKMLEESSAKWAGWEQTYVMRTAAATAEMFEMHDELQGTLDRIAEERSFLTRPRDSVASGPYGSAIEADAMYANRHERLAELREMEARAQGEFVDRIQAMTDPDPEPGQEGTSMMNRPAERLAAIGREQERLTNDLRATNARIRQLQEEMSGLVRRPVDGG